MFVGSSQDAWRPMRTHVLRLDMRLVAGAMHDLGVGELLNVMELPASCAAATTISKRLRDSKGTTNKATTVDGRSLSKPMARERSLKGVNP